MYSHLEVKIVVFITPWSFATAHLGFDLAPIDLWWLVKSFPSIGGAIGPGDLDRCASINKLDNY